MKSVILIAVRMKSTRLPKKALAKIEGKRMIEHLVERVKRAKESDEVILCTSTHPDDKVLIGIARMMGIKWFTGSEDDVLKRFIDAAKKEGAKIIVRVTGDNPLTDPDYIDKAIRKHKETGADYTYNEGLPEGTKPEVISVDALEKCREMAENPEMSEYMTLYFKNSKFFKSAKVYSEEEVSRPEYRLTVDTKKDLMLIRKIYKKFYKKNPKFNLREVVKFLDRNPKLIKMNKNIKPKKISVEIINGRLVIIDAEKEQNMRFHK